jgi:hypothetical protein
MKRPVGTVALTLHGRPSQTRMSLVGSATRKAPIIGDCRPGQRNVPDEMAQDGIYSFPFSRIGRIL